MEPEASILSHSPVQLDSGKSLVDSTGFYKDAEHPLTQPFWQEHDLSNRLQNLKQKIEKIKDKIETSRSNLISVSDEDIQIYKEGLKCTELDIPLIQDLLHIRYEDLVMKADSTKKTTNGWSGADTKNLSDGDVKIFAKKFGDVKAGLEELLQSLIALEINPLPKEIKMTRIYDATYCPKILADSEDCLSIIMEGAQGHDIEYCLSQQCSTDAIKACAKYLAMFHITNHKNLSNNININDQYISHAANAYHTLILNLLKEEDDESKLLALSLGKMSLDNIELKSDTIIRSLATPEQEKFRYVVQDSCDKLKKNAAEIYRSLSPSESQHTTPSGTVISSSHSSAINSSDKDKIDSYQKRKDEHDQRRIDRHIDLAENEAKQGNDPLFRYHEDEIVNILDERDDRFLALAIANGSNNEYIRLNNQASENCRSSSTEKQTPYFLTTTHGDAHGNNFFYDKDESLKFSKDSFQRVAMIDFATIIRTYGGIGDPAEDVGRFLGSLWDWGVRQAIEGSENYKLIHNFQKEFMDAYLELIKDSKIIKEHLYEKFEKTFKENCNFYKLRYYKVIFNATKDENPQKDREIKLKILNSWLEENANLTASLQTISQEKYMREESKDRPWESIENGGISSHLPERSEVFIESFDKKNQSYLTLLWKELHDTNTATLSSKAAIAGMGGVGKTSLALEYAHEALEKKAYNFIYWLSSGTEESLLRGYKKLLLELGIPHKDIEGKDEDAIIDLVKLYVPAKGKCLLIYDNTPGSNFLTGKVPLKTHILTTSRDHEGWEKPPINLDVFREEDSVKYLLRITGLQKNHEIAEELANELGHLPLALAHAAHYIKLVGGENVSVNHFKKYLEEFRKDNPLTHLEEKKDAFNNPKSDITYENLIGRTLRMSMKLGKDDLSELAKKLIVYASYLDPDAIPEDIFLGCWLDQKKLDDVQKDDPDAIPEGIFLENWPDQRELNEAISQLSSLSLIKSSQNEFSIHRLVQLVMRKEEEAKTQDILIHLAATFNTLFKENVHTEEQIDKLANYFPHMLELIKHSKQHLKIFSEVLEQLKWAANVVFYSKLTTPDKLDNQILKIENERCAKKIQVLYEGKNRHAMPPYKAIPHWLKQIAEQSNHTIQASLGFICFFGDDHAGALYWFNKAALQGNVTAKFFLGHLHAEGKGVEEDKDKAHKYYLEAAEEGYMEAQSALGSKNVAEQNYEEANKWLRKAADQGDAKSQHRLGLMLNRDKDTDRARELYILSAKQGYDQAQFALGMMYHKGQPKNYIAAEDCYKEAALQGHREAQFMLGFLYCELENFEKAENWLAIATERNHPFSSYVVSALNYLKILHEGKTDEKISNYFRCLEKLLTIINSVETDYELQNIKENWSMAIEWCLKTVKQIYIKSLRITESMMRTNDEEKKNLIQDLGEEQEEAIFRQLREMHKNGQELPYNFQQALKVYAKNAEQGDKEDQYILGYCYVTIFEDFYKALNLLESAAQQGHILASFLLGNMYHDGKGVLQDDKKACEHYIKAANEGHEEALFKLGILYFFVFNDFEEAFKWFSKSAEQENINAQFMLGLMLLKGIGVQQSDKLAATWFMSSAIQGHKDAQFMLGDMYFNNFIGLNPNENKKEALFWFSKAAIQGHSEAQTMLESIQFTGTSISSPKTKYSPQTSSERLFTTTTTNETSTTTPCSTISSQPAIGPSPSAFPEEHLMFSTKTISTTLEKKNQHLIINSDQNDKENNVEPSIVEEFLIAAEKGNADAQYELGCIYAEGYEVAQDDIEAYKWFSKAADQGHQGARDRLGIQ